MNPPRNLSPMLAKPYAGGPFVNTIVMPKMDGVQATYYDGRFYSRDGKVWNERTLAHIIPPRSAHPIDGQLYAHGLKLQEINERVAVKRVTPHPDASAITFYCYDLMLPMTAAIKRMEDLGQLFADQAGSLRACKNTPWMTVAGELAPIFNQWVKAGYEGVMLKNPLGHYIHSDYANKRTDNLYKVKDFKGGDDGVYVCTGFARGEGKAADVVGTLDFQTETGLPFSVGTFRATYDERRSWLTAGIIGRSARLQFLTLSNAGVPLTASFIEWVEPTPQ